MKYFTSARQLTDGEFSLTHLTRN